MLFMGEEWAASTPWQFFTDFDEPELAAAVRSGRREEFAEHGWDPERRCRTRSPPSTRDASVLDWAELGIGDHARLLDWYRSLISLRRSTPDLRADDLSQVHATYDEELRWFTLTRGDASGRGQSRRPAGRRTAVTGPCAAVLAWGDVEVATAGGSLAGSVVGHPGSGLRGSRSCA